jgi:eukaryotic-like serine/threonine-protein kinase
VNDAGHDTANETTLVGQLLFNKLRVDSVLGQGGMGTVYRVTHLGTHHQRALKVMNPQIRLHEEALARFLREATVSGTLKSPHVVETLDSGQLPDGSFYVLMELLDGEPLNDIVERGPMKLPRIARLLRQACSALALAHDKGIVHRDIKPDNLFVVRGEGGEESVKILDFGIARFRQQADVLGQLTGENAILGTPLYMAPEQIGSANVADGRADVYALGVVLYEALSGRKPYTAQSFAELVAHIFDGHATPLEHTAPGLTPRAYEVVRRAMARKAEDRYQSAREMAEALAELERPWTPPGHTDPLAKTATSIAPPVAAPIPTPSAPAAMVPSDATQMRRSGALWPWALGIGAVLGAGALGVSQLGGGPSADPPPTVGEPVAAIVAGPDAGAAGPDGGVDTGVPDVIDAGVDASARRGDRPRRDAGRARPPGGLLDPDEIYGGGGK